MILPTVHLNGTAKDDLVGTLVEASTRLNDAYAAIRLTAPHGRDYYPQGPDALHTATQQHMKRLATLDSLIAEVDETALQIDAM